MLPSTSGAGVQSDLTPFVLYVPTHRNTADRPSRVFGGDVRRSLGFVPRPMAELPLLVVLHLFAGLRRPGDLEWWLHELAPGYGVQVLVISLDMALGQLHNLLRNETFSGLRFLAWNAWLGWGPWRPSLLHMDGCSTSSRRPTAAEVAG